MSSVSQRCDRRMMSWSMRLLFCLICLSLCVRQLGSASEPEADQPKSTEWKYQAPVLERLYQRWSKASEGVQQDSWLRRPVHNSHARSGGYWYTKWWSDRELVYKNGLPVPPVHFLRVEASPGVRPSQPTLMTYVGMTAMKIPRSGWGVRCDLGCKFDNSRPVEERPRWISEITFYRIVNQHPAQAVLRFPNVTCAGKVSLDGFRYQYGVSISAQDVRQDTRALLVSPESFRRTVLASLERLEELVRQHHQARSLLGNFVAPINWSARDGAPMVPDERKPQALGKDHVIHDRVLNDALQKIAQLRFVLRQDAVSMHQALLDALPPGDPLR